MPGKQWRSFGNLNGSDLAKKAIVTFVCQHCIALYERAAPPNCDQCGRIGFDRFDSKSEARRWVQLRLLQRAGEISELRRQIPYPLMTITPDGHPVQFGKYIADFVYVEGGIEITEDNKAKAGITPEAKLKLRVMEASGRPVRLTSN